MRNGIIAVAVAAAIIIGIAVASNSQKPATPGQALENAATQAEQSSSNLWNQAQDLVPQTNSVGATATQLEQAAQESVLAIQQQAPSATIPASQSLEQAFDTAKDEAQKAQTELQEAKTQLEKAATAAGDAASTANEQAQSAAPAGSSGTGSAPSTSSPSSTSAQ